MMLPATVARENCLGEHRTSLANRRMPRELTVRDVRANPHAAIAIGVAVHLDIAEREPPDADQRPRRQHIQPHQVDERRPASEEHGPRLVNHGHRRVTCGGRFLVAEGFHRSAPTRRTAAMMLG
jgi:hypothetical protein